MVLYLVIFGSPVYGSWVWDPLLFNRVTPGNLLKSFLGKVRLTVTELDVS